METIRLRDGSEVTIRPIEPGDAGHLREVWDGMSELSRRRRFLAASSGPASDEDVRYLVDVDHRRHEALVALDRQDRAVAVARYVRTPGEPESAEVAVVVVDDWQRRGLATALLERLNARARENGIQRYTAIVSEDNDIVLGGLERAGAARIGSTGEEELEYVFELPADGIGDRLSDVLRSAGEAPRDYLSAGLRRLAAWRRRG